MLRAPHWRELIALLSQEDLMPVVNANRTRGRGEAASAADDDSLRVNGSEDNGKSNSELSPSLLKSVCEKGRWEVLHVIAVGVSGLADAQQLHKVRTVCLFVQLMHFVQFVQFVCAVCLFVCAV